MILNSTLVLGFSETSFRISSAKLIFLFPIFKILSFDFIPALSADPPEITFPIIGFIKYEISIPKY